MRKKCEWCLELFTVRDSTHRYCCDAHRKAANNDRPRLIKAREPYGSHEFDSIVGNWMQTGSYQVGKLFGSVAA